MDRILAHLHVTSPSPQVSFDGVEQESDSVPESGPSRSIQFSLGGDEEEPSVPAELVAAGITPIHIWQQLLPSPPPATQQRPEDQRQNNPHWDRTEEYPFKYGRLQAHGERVRQWIESPESPGCYINPSTLSIEDFEANNCYLLAPRLHAVDEDFADQISDLGFELGRTHWSFQIRAPDFAWLGDTGPGVIIMKSVDRASQDAYPISEIARALYMRDFDIDTLQHVFFQNVQNVETVPFVRRALYTEENNLSWPRKAPQTWAYGTPEYDGFLGSRIGKIVGYLVLGAYPRGTRRIIQIVTWAADPENHNRRIQIRFDIDFVPTA
jgi:hypothetical protein